MVRRDAEGEAGLATEAKLVDGLDDGHRLSSFSSDRGLRPRKSPLSYHIGQELADCLHISTDWNHCEA